MLSPDSAVGMVFNGAIYNFRELRVELEAQGYDSRVRRIRKSWCMVTMPGDSTGCLARLRGMFAFALWDDRKRTLFLVRDRLGVKPLVYSYQNGQIAFASTVRALRAAGFADEIDDLASLSISSLVM